MEVASVQSDLIVCCCGQLLKDKVGKALEGVADSVCSGIGDEMLRLLKPRFAKAAEYIKDRGGID